MTPKRMERLIEQLRDDVNLLKDELRALRSYLE